MSGAIPNPPANRKVAPARDIAVRVLVGVAANGDYANLALRREWERRDTESRDRALSEQLVLGVLRRQLRLDCGLAGLCRHPLDRLPLPILVCLRLGVYELLFCERIPNYATLDQYVRIAGAQGHRGLQSLVNAVLRRVTREGDRVLEIADNLTPAARLAVEHSHPEWLVTRWLQRFGAPDTTALLSHNNAEAPITVRLNPLRELTALSAAMDACWRPGRWCRKARLLRDGEALDLLRRTVAPDAYSFQDEGSMLVDLLLDPRPGETVVDACAGVGGKALHLVEIMRDQGSVIAVEPQASRASAIREQSKSRQLRSLSVVHGTAEDFAPAHPLIADRCLVDAPCSGTGVLGRRPDIRWRRQPEDVDRMSETQLRILFAAGAAVRPGGILVYSTCSLEAEENEHVVSAFLDSQRDFEPEPFRLFGREAFQATLLPHRTGTDGMFVARLRRVSRDRELPAEVVFDVSEVT